MRIRYLAELRNPIAQNWIAYFVEAGHRVEIVSSYPYDRELLPPALRGVPVQVVPLAGSWLLGSRRPHSTGTRASGILQQVRGGPIAGVLTFARHWFAPLDLVRLRSRVRAVMSEGDADLIHAMRLPFEGIVGAFAKRDRPLAVSTWGNDLVLWARRFPTTRAMTRRAFPQIDGLHSDCQRDLRLAIECGFPSGRPTVVLPGAGGVQRDRFCPASPDPELATRLAIPSGAPVVVNPRGLRAYVRNDTFFRAIPLVLRQRPDAIFLGVAMANNAVAEGWVRKLGVAECVRLLPTAARSEMPGLFHLSMALVSLGEYDGTPNTLLEGMACGCLPVAGDIESVREWIRDGENGLVCDLSSHESVAAAILRAINDNELRDRALAQNQRLIDEKADYVKVMPKAEAFYQKVLARSSVT